MKKLMRPDLFSFIMTSAVGACFSAKAQMAEPMSPLPSLSIFSMVELTYAPSAEAWGSKNWRRKLSEVASCSSELVRGLMRILASHIPVNCYIHCCKYMAAR